MNENVRKAKTAGNIFEDAEDCGREAKQIFEEIGDPDGVRKAEEVERVAREAKEYVKSRINNR